MRLRRNQLWTVAKVVDPGTHIRYACLYITGLVELHEYQKPWAP